MVIDEHRGSKGRRRASGLGGMTIACILALGLTGLLAVPGAARTPWREVGRDTDSSEVGPPNVGVTKFLNRPRRFKLKVAASPDQEFEAELSVDCSSRNLDDNRFRSTTKKLTSGFPATIRFSPSLKAPGECTVDAQVHAPTGDNAGGPGVLAIRLFVRKQT